MRLDTVRHVVLSSSLTVLACAEEPHEPSTGTPLDRQVERALEPDAASQSDAAAALLPSSTNDAATSSDPHTGDSAQDAGSREPLAAGSEELRAALEIEGFRNYGRRAELVVGALCQQRVACGVSESEGDCRRTYRVDWHDRIAQGLGLPVPCHDALLDTVSCLALAPCNGEASCDVLVTTQEEVCTEAFFPARCEWAPSGAGDAGTGAAPTKGPIPEAATNPEGRGLNWDLVPDFVPAWAKDGSLAGYVRKQDLMDFGCGRMVVVDESLQHIVGHMVAGVGFVPLGDSDAGATARW